MIKLAAAEMSKKIFPVEGMIYKIIYKIIHIHIQTRARALIIT